MNTTRWRVSNRSKRLPPRKARFVVRKLHRGPLLHAPFRNREAVARHRYRSSCPGLRHRGQRRLHTGEVSAQMIASLGVEYVILGHSERRQYTAKPAPMLNKKMEQAYANNLAPIYCVGENLEEREAGKHFDVVRKQIEEVVFNHSRPVQKIDHRLRACMAIGTGKTASAGTGTGDPRLYPQGAGREIGDAANETVILYGGSCKPGTQLNRRQGRRGRRA